MRIAICDDETGQLDLLDSSLRAALSDRHFTVERFSSGARLLENCRAGKRYDIVFLDIVMGTPSGMETARQLFALDRRAVILFLTNIPDYAIEGYEVRAFRYLIKPLSPDNFAAALDAAVREADQRRQHFYPITLKDGSIVRIEVGEILYLESFGRSVTAHLADGSELVFTARFSDVELSLDELDFLRIHKSYIANLRHIVQISRSSATVRGGAVLPLGRKRQKETFDAFTLFLTSGRC